VSLWARIRVPISANPARLQTHRWENQSPSLEATGKCLRENFQAFLLQQGRRRFSVPRLVGLHLPKQKRKQEKKLSAVECL